MNNVFFNSEGITITAINHLANLAKESVKQLEQELKAFSFVEEYISLLVSHNTPRKSKSAISDISSVELKLKKIGEMNAFIAWAREAIKEKDQQTSELKLKDFNVWHAENYKDPLEFPVGSSKNHKQDIFNEMSVKDLNEYYQLEAEVAVIGKFIHPSGAYSSAREDLFQKINNPVTTVLSGSDTIIREYHPVMELSDVDNLFFQLQSKHRALNAQLNQIKYNIDQKVLEREMADRTKFEAELNECMKKRDSRLNEFEKYKASELERIKKLKVVIPDALKETYEYLKELGK